MNNIFGCITVMLNISVFVIVAKKSDFLIKLIWQDVEFPLTYP